MCGRPLKNYDKYKEKLLKYAEGVELEVVFKEEFDEGIYIPSKRRIRIDTELDESTEIAVLLHELGHALDDAIVDEATSTPLNEAYKAFYKAKPTAKQINLVIESEKNAWEYGRVIAKKLRIPLGRWYEYEFETAIKDYKKAHEDI